MQRSECVFCAIVAGEAPATLVGGDGHGIAIVPLNPVCDGHVIVLPFRHITDAAADPETAGRAMVLAAAMAQEYESSNIITSIGAPASATVMHLHIHVVPRRPDDGLLLPWSTQPSHLRRLLDSTTRHMDTAHRLRGELAVAIVQRDQANDRLARQLAEGREIYEDTRNDETGARGCTRGERCMWNAETGLHVDGTPCQYGPAGRAAATGDQD